MSLTVTAPPRIRPRLECGLAVEFGGGRPLPVVADYLEALRASRSLYGQESDLSPVAAGWGNPYGSMAESVVSGLGLRRDDAGQDLIPTVSTVSTAPTIAPSTRRSSRTTGWTAGRANTSAAG